MAFKFQVHSDIEFNHNRDFLEKADKYKPKLHQQIVNGKRLVKVVKDSAKLENTGVKKVADISNLKNMGMTRDDKIVIDFGQHCVGQFSIHIEHQGSPMDAPLAFKIKFAEMPNEFNYKSEDYHGWLSKSWIQEEMIHVDKLPVDLKLPRRYSFRYVEISVIDTSPKWKTYFSKPQVLTQSAVDTENFKQPQIQDLELKKIYQVGLNTLHDCMQDVFEDGPKRDRRLWLGDLRLQALAR